jgi:hypothetical protein
VGTPGVHAMGAGASLAGRYLAPAEKSAILTALAGCHPSEVLPRGGAMPDVSIPGRPAHPERAVGNSGQFRVTEDGPDVPFSGALRFAQWVG